MTKDVKPLNIYQRINAVMKEVKYVQKNEKKTGLYSFVSHDNVTGALHMPMADNGIVMVPTIESLVQDGNRTIVKMDIKFINADDPTDLIQLSYYGYGIDTQDKGIGKAVSYAVKYALLKMFCLETGDDVEKDDIEYKSVASNPDEVKAQKKKIISLVGEQEIDLVTKYLQEMSVTYKKSIDEIVMLYTDMTKFQNDFTVWKEKPVK